MINKKWVKILKAARKQIESEENRYVCMAIRDCKVGFFSMFYNGAKYKLRKEIELRLDGCLTVSGWLETQDETLWSELYKLDGCKSYRLAWIDNMIEEFSGTSAFYPITTWEY